MSPNNQNKFDMRNQEERQGLGNNLNDKFHAKKAPKDAGYNLITNTLLI